jgi:tetrahydromethanopterin S-methyltransferase subunit G
LGVGEIAAAIILGVCGIVAAVQGRKQSKKIEAVHEEVRTNHGRRLGQRVEELGEDVGALLGLFAEHADHDTRNFKALEQRLDRLDAKVESNW